MTLAGTRPPIGTLRAIPISPFDRFGQRVSTSITLLVTVLVAIAGTISCGLIVGPAIAVLTGLSLRYAKAWIALRLLAVASLLLSIAYVLAKQTINRYGLGFDWGARFEIVHQPILFTLAALFADVIVEALRAGWRRNVES